MSGTREMPTAGPVARVLSSELRARASVEHMRRAVELTLKGLPINQAYRPRAGNRAENTLRGSGSCGQPGSCRKCRPAAIEDDGLDAEILEDEPNTRGVGHLAAIIRKGERR